MVAGGEYARHREFTARHVVRQLGLGEDAFPLTVSLYVKLTDRSAGGYGRRRSRWLLLVIQVLERYEFASLKEVRP